LLLALAALLAAPAARADLADETSLAERFAPAVRLVEQPEECGPGEPYEPTDVEVLFAEPTVALRGPWNPTVYAHVASDPGHPGRLARLESPRRARAAGRCRRAACRDRAFERLRIDRSCSASLFDAKP
jgi:hypothetical protein